MTLETARKIVAAAERNGDELRVREKYSGRGMYGEETAGVIGNARDICRAAFAAGVDDGELRWDAMGRDSIAY